MPQIFSDLKKDVPQILRLVRFESNPIGRAGYLLHPLQYAGAAQHFSLSHDVDGNADPANVGDRVIQGQDAGIVQSIGEKQR